MSVKDDTEILMQDPLFLTKQYHSHAARMIRNTVLTIGLNWSFTISRVLNFPWGKY